MPDTDSDAKMSLDEKKEELKSKVKRFTSLIIEISKDIDNIYKENKDLEFYDEILRAIYNNPNGGADA